MDMEVHSPALTNPRGFLRFGLFKTLSQAANDTSYLPEGFEP